MRDFHLLELKNVPERDCFRNFMIIPYFTLVETSRLCYQGSRERDKSVHAAFR